MAAISAVESPSPRRFRYLADPLFIATLIIYPVNRFFLKPHHIGAWFTHGYLNDVLCLPMFVPMILYIQYRIGARRHFQFPRAWEIAVAWAAFALIFQVITPRFPKTFITAGDPWDMLAYAVGGAIAWMIWNRPRIRYIAAQRPGGDIS